MSNTKDNNNYDPLLLQNQMCFPLYAASRKVVNLYTPYLKPLGLTYTQYIVFLVLWEKDHIPVGELGSRLFLDSGTLTPMLKKLENAGYISRSRSPEDERVVIVDLTDAGRALREKVVDIPNCVGSCFTMSQEEAELLYRTLYSILNCNPEGGKE